MNILPEELISKEMYKGEGDTIEAYNALRYLNSLNPDDKENIKPFNFAYTDNPVTMGNGDFIIRGFTKDNSTIISTKLVYNNIVLLVMNVLWYLPFEIHLNFSQVD